MRHAGVLPHADELRVRPEPHPGRAEHLVADGELPHAGADGFHHSRELAAEDPPPWSADTKDKAADEGDGMATASVGVASRAIQPVDRGGADPDQDFVGAGYRPLDVFQSQDVGRPVAVVDHGSHRTSLRLRLSRD